MDHCPRCDSTNVMYDLFCKECGWMNRKVIMARTGPELDSLIATRVMGWIEMNPRTSAAYWALPSPMNPQTANLDWSPSTDLNIAMGDVVREMKDRGYLIELRTYPDPVYDQPGVTAGCRFQTYDEIDKEWDSPKQWYPGDDEGSAHADCIPLAICRAALVAISRQKLAISA